MDNIFYILNKTNSIISELDKLKLHELENIIDIANDAYYNTDNPKISDNIYDIIMSYISKKYPTSRVLLQVGAPERNNTVKLPYYLASENKTYESDKKLYKWLTKYGTDTMVLSVKADGVSILWVIDDFKFYTRGDGTYGRDVTEFFKHIQFNKDIDNTIQAIRGELVIDKPYNRSDVVGQLNKISPDDNICKYIHFIVYEIINPRLTQADQFDYFITHNMMCVDYKIIHKSIINYNYLREIYAQYKQTIKYDIDGLIIRNNNINEEPTNLSNPKWSIAYKLNTEYGITTVIDIDWNITKYNVYTPLINVVPILLGKSTIKRVNGYNAKYVIDNNINTGAVLRIVLSGSVIPKISDILEISTNPIIMPMYSIYNGLQLLSTCDGGLIKRIIYFMNQLGFKHISEAAVEELCFLNDIKELSDIFTKKIILDTKYKRNLQLINTVANIKKSTITKSRLISALSIRNISFKRAVQLIEYYPDLFCDITYSYKDFTIIPRISKTLSQTINNTISENYDMIRKMFNILSIN